MVIKEWLDAVYIAIQEHGIHEDKYGTSIRLALQWVTVQQRLLVQLSAVRGLVQLFKGVIVNGLQSLNVLAPAIIIYRR